MTVAEMLAAMEQLCESERARALEEACLGDGDQIVASLGKSSRKSLLRALRRLASTARA